MPITLDYPGDLIKTDYPFRISGHLDGETGPLVALSFHDQAYLGWVNEMMTPKDDPDFEEYYRRAAVTSACHYEARSPVWLVSTKRQEKAEMNDWNTLILQFHRMYDTGRSGSVVFCEKIWEWIFNAESAERRLRRANDNMASVKSTTKLMSLD
jgi:hypothetical protein